MTGAAGGTWGETPWHLRYATEPADLENDPENEVRCDGRS
ncbi:hypothetical protein STXM2123_3447 [Streptomyces sp. F-3]|nr:hypothetical protein STXM2123_3447 [Streptomyces sp. F-3]